MSSQNDQSGSPSRGEVADSDPASAGVPRPGEIIAGKYEVLRVLGVGGMGVVVSAKHMQLGQRVAIKFMRAEAARDANAATRFLREAQAAVALSSEHVAKVLDVGTLESGAPYMVMEFLAGVDLSAVVERSGPMPIADALSALLQACEAIAEAHSLGMVHRDLKPANLFVSKRADGTSIVKVLDFGISKTLALQSSGGGLTASGSLVGSPAYMSPEQVRAPKEVDARSDVWALGVILYELLAGKSPFEADTLGETLARIVADAPAPIRNVRPEIPEGLARAIAQCLERNVGRRFQSVADLASALLPFAPPEATLSVERVLRIARAAKGPALETATFSGASALGAATPSGREETLTSGQLPAPALGTASSWQHPSGATSRSAGVRRNRVALVGSGLVLLAGIGVGIYALGGRSQTKDAASAASGGATTVAPSPPAPKPVEPAVSAEPVAAVAEPEPTAAPPVSAPRAAASSANSKPPLRAPPPNVREAQTRRPPTTKPQAAPTTQTQSEKDIF
jgi:serine/threonine-protein kinase